MKTAIVNIFLSLLKPPVDCDTYIIVKYDKEGVIDQETIIKIFDKRQVINGVRKYKHDFIHKRRKLLKMGNEAKYK
jgi:hypothetical protein